jgi:hypothetical protein
MCVDCVLASPRITQDDPGQRTAFPRWFCHSRGKPHPISELRGVKRNIAKLGSECSLGSFKMNFLILMVQLIVMSENICSRMTTAGSNSRYELANLDDSIRRQLMQLHMKLAQNIHKDWMWWHAKPSSKKILEHHSFVHPRIKNRLHQEDAHILLENSGRHSPEV